MFQLHGLVGFLAIAKGSECFSDHVGPMGGTIARNVAVFMSSGKPRLGPHGLRGNSPQTRQMGPEDMPPQPPKPPRSVNSPTATAPVTSTAPGWDEPNLPWPSM